MQTSYPYASRDRIHVYYLEMLTYHRKTYVPTPLTMAYRKKGIKVGDVGVITANGAFHLVFIVCQSDPGSNPDILPDGFERVASRIRTSKIFDAGTCLTSNGNL